MSKKKSGKAVEICFKTTSFLKKEMSIIWIGCKDGSIAERGVHPYKEALFMYIKTNKYRENTVMYFYYFRKMP